MALMAVVAVIANAQLFASGCFYTGRETCVPAGFQIVIQSVRCWWGSGWADLSDYDYTDSDAYRPVALPVDRLHPDGYVGTMPLLGYTKVWLNSVRIDPQTCNATITQHTSQMTIPCLGTAADPNSAPCWLVEIKPSALRSYYCSLTEQFSDPYMATTKAKQVSI